MARLVDGSVEDAVRGEEKVAVAFSGGVDSSILARCASRRVEVVACSAYVKGSMDSDRAAEAARMLGVDFAGTEVSREMVADALSTLELPFVPTLMDRSLWGLYRLVSSSAKRSGARVILLGQLADELFGGYAKYAEALGRDGEEAARNLMRSDLDEYGGRGEVRDVSACSGWVTPRLPFRKKELVEFATSLPVEFKIRGGVRKAVLRRAAIILGVPEALAGSAKKAAQYSSGVQKLVAGLPF